MSDEKVESNANSEEQQKSEETTENDSKEDSKEKSGSPATEDSESGGDSKKETAAVNGTANEEGDDEANDGDDKKTTTPGDAGDEDKKILDSKGGSASNEDKKIFVGGIAYDVSNDDLSTYFRQYGEVAQAQVKYDRNTGRSRGFAFVEFAAHDACQKALAKREQQIKGKHVEVKPAKSRENKKVFVGGLPSDHPEEELRKHFEQYGRVEDIEWPYDKQRNTRRNFAFIVFEEEDAADRASANPKQQFGERECDVKKAVPQGRRMFQIGGMGGRGAFRGGYGGRGGGGWFGNGMGGAGGWGMYGAGWNDWYGNAAATGNYFGSAGAAGYGHHGHGAYGGTGYGMGATGAASGAGGAYDDYTNSYSQGGGTDYWGGTTGGQAHTGGWGGGSGYDYSGAGQTQGGRGQTGSRYQQQY